MTNKNKYIQKSIGMSTNVNDVPKYLPRINDRNGLEFVNWGDDNLYPYELLDLFHGSAIHKAIINTKVNLICGDNIKIVDKCTLSNSATDHFIKNVNAYESLYDLLYKVSMDLEVFGGFSLKVVWSRDGKRIKYLYHIPMEQVRCGKLNSEGQISEYFICRDWRNRYKYKYIGMSNINYDAKYNRAHPEQIFYYKKYSPGIEYYPVPTYESGVYFIDANLQIGKYYSTYAHNNMCPPVVVTHPGIGSPEELKEFYNGLIEQFSGAENAGKFMLMAGNGTENTPVISILGNDDGDKKYETIQRIILENICYAHQINPVVAGLQTEGSLGQRNEIIEAREMFKQDIILKEQNQILRIFNYFMEHNEYALLSIKEDNLVIPDTL